MILRNTFKNLKNYLTFKISPFLFFWQNAGVIFLSIIES